MRGPLAPEHERELVDSGVASSDCPIRRVGEDEAWQRPGDHRVWRSIASTQVKLAFATDAAADPGIVRVQTRGATATRVATWRELRRKEPSELGRFLPALGFASAVAGLTGLGGIMVFTCDWVTASILLFGLVRVGALVLVGRIVR